MSTQPEMQSRLNTMINKTIVEFAAQHSIDERHILNALDDAKSDTRSLLGAMTVTDFVSGGA